MALRILKGADPVKVSTLTVVIYAPPGLGKTSAAFTASRPLLLDFDAGAYRSAFRKDSVPVAAWGDVADITAADLADYDTVIVDTAGRALDALTADLITKNPKLKGYGGALSLQGYGALKSTFMAWLKLVRGFGKDVILTAHSDEQRSGDEIVERLDVQGGSKSEIYKAADAMGRIMIRDKRRILTFDSSDTAFAKNPAQIEPLAIPHFAEQPSFLANVIQSMKDGLNTMTEAQKAAVDEMAEWSTRIKEAEDAEAFNGLLAQGSNVSEAARSKVKAMLVKEAKAHGLVFSKDAGEFVENDKAA